MTSVRTLYRDFKDLPFELFFDRRGARFDLFNAQFWPNSFFFVASMSFSISLYICGTIDVNMFLLQVPSLSCQYETFFRAAMLTSSSLAIATGSNSPNGISTLKITAFPNSLCKMFNISLFVELGSASMQLLNLSLLAWKKVIKFCKI